MLIGMCAMVRKASLATFAGLCAEGSIYFYFYCAMMLLLDPINQRPSLLGLPMLAKLPCLVALAATIGLLAPTGAFGQGLVGLTPDTSASTTRTTVSMDVQNPGVAVVSNGQRSGSNLYHRFDQFDTTKDNLDRVFFDMGIRGPDNVVNNMIVGVSSTSGSHISVPLVLSQPADLIFMSPYGITVSGQAGFGWGSLGGDVSNLSTIVLTTANRLIFDNTQNNFFEVLSADLSSQGAYPLGTPSLPDGLRAFGGLEGHIWLKGGTEQDDFLNLVFDKSFMLLDLNTMDIDRNIYPYYPVGVNGYVALSRPFESVEQARGAVIGQFDIFTRLDLSSISRFRIAGDVDVSAAFVILYGSALVLDGSVLLKNRVSLINSHSENPDLSRLHTFDQFERYPALRIRGGKTNLTGGLRVLGDTVIAAYEGDLFVQSYDGAAIRALSLDEMDSSWGFSVSDFERDSRGLQFRLHLSTFYSASGLNNQTNIDINGPILLGGGGLTKWGWGKIILNSEGSLFDGVTEVLGGHLQVNGPVPALAYCSNGSSNVCNWHSSQLYWKDRYNPLADPDLLAFIRKEYGIDPMASIDPATYVPSFQGLAPAPVALSSLELAPSERSIESSSTSQKEYLKSLQALAPELFNGGMPTTPTPQQIQAGMQREVLRIRSLAKGNSRGVLQSQGNDRSSWIASTSLAAAPSALPVFHAAAYQPAVVYLRFSEDHGPSKAAQPPAPGDDAFLDFTLIPLEGPVKGLRVPLSKKLFISQLRDLYASLARQDRLDLTKPTSASRQLYTLLIAPIVPFLEAKGITTLLIAADQGLQAVPFAALHDGQRFFGDRYGFSVTPSLALTNFNSSSSAGQPIFVAGASKFDGLAPLALVPQELAGIGANAAANIFLNRNFTPELFFEKAGDPHYSRIHVATHAEFLPGGPASSYLYSGVGPMPMSSFSRLRLLRKGTPLDLITFSACRTALGDPSSELGFAGLAIQAGARSAAGTLWYVDDVASSAFFIQMYRYLNQGVPKAEAVQLTRQLFMRGLLHLEGDRLLSADGSVVLDKLDSVQQRRVRDGLDHPYFWAGIELVGSPW